MTSNNFIKKLKTLEMNSWSSKPFTIKLDHHETSEGVVFTGQGGPDELDVRQVEIKISSQSDKNNYVTGSYHFNFVNESNQKLKNQEGVLTGRWKDSSHTVLALTPREYNSSPTWYLKAK